jgi:CBS domain-containing protein
LYAKAQEVAMHQLLSSILEEKSAEVLQIDGGATVFEAITKMVDSNVGSLLVTEDGEVAGIMTERDYLRRVTLQGRTDKETQVREIMSAPLVVATPETSIDECMAMMTDRRIRHIPVVEDEEVVGVVSIGDLVKFRAKEQAFEIKYLTDYITGR